jgi:hypothetical protein
MLKAIPSLVAFLIFGAIHSTSFAITQAECAAQYDKCKKDVSHIFDKGPCKKARERCEGEVIQTQVIEQKAETKNRMMGGDTVQGNNLPTEQEQAKEAARRRLEARGVEKPGIVDPGSTRTNRRGMMMNPNGTETTLDRKAEAQRRLRERQRAQGAPAPGSSMRDRVNSN